jgi:hypothetical protein
MGQSADRPTKAEVIRNVAHAQGKAPANPLCVWCLALLGPSRTKPRRFCSERCRKRAARATWDRFVFAQTRADQLLRALKHMEKTDANPS